MKKKPSQSAPPSRKTGSGKTRTTGARKSAQASSPSNSLTRDERISREFDEVLHLIESARHRAFQAVNVLMIELYWNVGGYVSRKIAEQKWGKGTVQKLSGYIQTRQPGIRGFSPQNMWRMRQFYEAYRDQPILSTLLRELAWSSHLHILNKARLPEESKGPK